MVKKTKQNPDLSGSEKQKADKNRFMVLHNDDFNSFDYVIECLVDVCNHDVTQAEQCAYITHYKGRCDIKSGKFSELKPMKDNLIEKGLTVVIQ
ncbi:MAG: ATP-dependent Clp protease adaptor ClpS [Bacteroidota bacterium]